MGAVHGMMEACFRHYAHLGMRSVKHNVGGLYRVGCLAWICAMGVGLMVWLGVMG